MKLIIGLGNPGTKYARNRHNIGHLFLEYLMADGRHQENPSVKIVKSDSFMNDSGNYVKEKLSFYHLPPEALYIVHDDLDIRLGDYKIQLGIGPKVHYGINSIEQALGTKNFWRVRIGVDNRDESNRTPGQDYVLQDFNKKEVKVFESLFPKIWEELCRI